MKAIEVLEDFLKHSSFGEMQQPTESNAVKNNLAYAPVVSGQPSPKPTIVATAPANLSGNIPAMAPIVPSTNPKNFKLK